MGASMCGFLKPHKQCSQVLLVIGIDVVSGDTSTLHSFMPVVWTCDTSGYDFLIKHKLAKYLKESCILRCDRHLSFKYILKIVFVREISAK